MEDRTVKLGFCVAMGVLGLPGCGADIAREADTEGVGSTDATTGGGPLAAADPSQPGPWVAGVCTVQLVDPSRDRTLDIEVWYPVDPGAVDGTPNLYTLVGLGEVASSAWRDATPSTTHRWPVVLFSHGFGGVRFQSPFLTEHLATHGFVVAAPDHPGNRLIDFAMLGSDEAVAQSAIDRPLDLAFVLDRLVAGESCAAVDIDPDRVGATGHSFGGWTALQVGLADARVGAMFPLAPGFKNGATPDFVAELQRPVLFLGGSADTTTPFDSDQQGPWGIAAPPKYLARIEGAGHLDFSNLCDVPAAQAFIRDGCDPTVVDPALVHDRARTLATAFAHAFVAGRDHHLGLLEPGWAEALGDVTFWAQSG
jgi:predicted dienelactone hydrolase